MLLDTTSTGAFALQVDQVNLWEELETEQLEELGDLWRRHGVLLFRRQALSEAELVRFSRAFGDADVIVREDWQSQNQPEVIHISNMKNFFGDSIGGLGAGELDWHTDQSYVVEPATGSILYMVEMPACAPYTQWANLRAAYAGLDVAMQARIADLDVIYDYLARQSTYDDEPSMSSELRAKTPLVTHPLVNRDPVTGEPSLYLDPTTATGIVGWNREEAMTLLRDLVAHATQDAYVYTHHWQIGDVVMWDNGFLMHRREAFEASGNRLLKRTTLRLPKSHHVVPAGQLA